MAVEDENYTRWAQCLKLESDCLFRDSLIKKAEDFILTKHLKQSIRFSADSQIILPTDSSSIERSLKKQSKQELLAAAADASLYLENGASFIKFGRKGLPKAKHVFLVSDALCWRDPQSSQQPDPRVKGLKLSDITHIEDGLP